MPVERTETLVIGAGQAGIAMSAHLSKRAAPHLVVERHRIAERWRSERWDSLVANGPMWHDRFAGKAFPGEDQNGFASARMIVDYLVGVTEQSKAPIRCNVEVNALHEKADGAGFRVETSEGIIDAVNVVVATGPFQRPVIPALVPAGFGITQLHSAGYRNPGQLPEGAVMVIGAGSSGVQIAQELRRAGKQVYLSVGAHDRPPRRYRGRDFCWWLGVLGMWDAKAADPSAAHVTIAVSGADGGHTVDFRRLAASGVALVGRAEAFKDGIMYFAADLARNIVAGDDNYLAMLDAADAYVAQEKLDLPEEPAAREIAPMPRCVAEPMRRLSLVEAGVTSIVWATGYVRDFSWLHMDVFDNSGKPLHQRGVSAVPGLYFLGLPWLSRRASPFIWGVWHDAEFLAEQISSRSRQLLDNGVSGGEVAGSGSGRSG